MKFVPHDYQAHAIEFIDTHPQAAILLGMGLGKTIITLTALNRLILDSFEIRKALIIAPLRVARDTWPAEIRKWDHLTHLRFETILGTPAQRKQALNRDAHIYITNRENLPWLVDECGPGWPFDMIVIDELSSFKNHQAQRFKALRKIRPHVTRIIGLTGTPAPNSLLDLWAPFRLIDHGQRLGKFITHYRNHYFEPDKRDGMRVFSWRIKPGMESKIYGAIEDITLSMQTTDYLTLPPVTYSNRDVHLSSAELKTYRKLKRDLVLELDDGVVDAPSAANLSGKLQQLASGAIYTESPEYQQIHNRKIDALGELIEQAQGNTMLVCYWFKHERERILSAFPQARALDTSEDFEAWNRGEVPVGLIHPASAGHGLNLQSGGHIMIWFTTPWSLELYQQANARLYRQGQTEPVSIVHLIAAETLDTQVLARLGDKNLTQQALVDAVAAELGVRSEGQVAA